MWWHAKRVEHVKIGQLVDGAHVRIIGNAVKHGDDVSGPHTGKVGLAATGWIYMSGLGAAAVQSKVERAARFAVEDGTGMIMIANEHITLDLEDHIVIMPTEGDAKPFGASVIARDAGIRSGGGGVINYHEGLLHPGDIVAVIGTVAHDANGALTLIGTEKDPIVISTSTKQLKD
jgi:hypothetical protein